MVTFFTGGGVSASIGLGLYFIESLINEKVDYPYFIPRS